MSEYKVTLDVYNGPLDLLLFLIRRDEVDVHDIPIARVTEQYVKYIELLQRLDPDAVSEFLVLAATLMEIKSRMLLPTPPPEEGDEDLSDPRLELVRQLLEYKKFKDAARYLEDTADVQSQKHPRVPVAPSKPSDEVELENLDIWDLFDAFNRLLEQTGGGRDAVHEVGVDDTPLALHADDIVDALKEAGGSKKFEEIFGGREKPEMIGLFLALLELIRNLRVKFSQDKSFATIWIHLLDASPMDIEDGLRDFSDVPEEGGGELASADAGLEGDVPRAGEVAAVEDATREASDDAAVDDERAGQGDDDPGAVEVVGDAATKDAVVTEASINRDDADAAYLLVKPNIGGDAASPLQTEARDETE